MSLEAWGDDDAQELPDGCWGPVTVECVVGCIKDLRAEPVYEGGKKENGISARFLARITLLEAEAGLRAASDPFVKDAERVVADDRTVAGERYELRERLRRDGPYRGMAEAFEVRTGVPFDHPDWRDESATWAAAWKAAKAQTSAVTESKENK